MGNIIVGRSFNFFLRVGAVKSITFGISTPTLGVVITFIVKNLAFWSAGTF